MDGTLERVSVELGGRVLRFERRLNHSVEEVWAALTQPEQLADWLAAPDHALNKGDKFALRFDNTGVVINGTVTQFDPPLVLEYSWDSQIVPESVPTLTRLAGRSGDNSCLTEFGDTRVRWELRPEGDTTMLTLSHMLPVPSEDQRYAGSSGQPAAVERLDNVLAGWHNHLDALTEGLGRQLLGRRQGKFSWDRYKDLRDKYSRMIR